MRYTQAGVSAAMPRVPQSTAIERALNIVKVVRNRQMIDNRFLIIPEGSACRSA